ncbi:MAG: hypothetical protein GSR83_00665 [Desulfurococcales archaeon]|nr:hypothetical protein [Desulfurococcales archaeon]
MSIRCPTLIVHHQAGKEYWAEQEIGDILLPHDPDVKIERTDYRGVLLVYTNIPSSKAYRLVTREILTSIDRVIPVEDCFIIRSTGDLERALNSITIRVRGFECVRANISLRGYLKERSLALDKEINKRLRVDKACRTVLYVESVDDLLMYGFVSR